LAGASKSAGQLPVAPLHSYERLPDSDKTFIRGYLFGPTIQFIREQLGDGAWEDFLATIDPQAKPVFLEEFVALAWYPLRVATLTVEALDTIGRRQNRPDILRHMARHNLDVATRGVFRAIFKLGSPEFMMKRSDQVWKKYYSRGEMRTLFAKDGEAVVRLDDVPDLTRLWSTTVLLSMEAVIVKAGGKEVVSELTRDISRGDVHSEFRYRWRV
jgi:hypothetical protein